MTDRISSFTVVLEKDLRADDAEDLMNAISQFRGVAGVTANVIDITQHVAEQRARQTLGHALMAVIWPDDPSN